MPRKPTTTRKAPVIGRDPIRQGGPKDVIGGRSPSLARPGKAPVIRVQNPRTGRFE